MKIDQVKIEGYFHGQLSIGCQDSHFVYSNDELTCAVICDGCTNGLNGFSNNQLGAAIASQSFVNLLVKQLRKRPKNYDFEMILNIVSRQHFGVVREVIKLMRINNIKEIESFVYNSLSYTIIGLVLSGENIYYFGIGNGCYGINKESFILEDKGNYFMTTQGGLLKFRPAQLYSKVPVVVGNTYWISSDGLCPILLSKATLSDFNFLINDNHENDNPSNLSFEMLFRRDIYKACRHMLKDDLTLIKLKI